MNGQHQELSVANQTRQGPYTSSEVCVLPEVVLLSLMLWFLLSLFKEESLTKSEPLTTLDRDIRRHWSDLKTNTQMSRSSGNRLDVLDCDLFTKCV